MGRRAIAGPTVVVRRALAVCGLLTLACTSGVANAACDDVRDAHRRTYGFKPTALTPAEREAKVKAMDQFWALVGARGAEGRRCLADLLAVQAADGYFAFDGASLLASLDRSSPTLALIARAVASTDLGEVEPAEYVRMVIWLGKNGVDTEGLSLKYLRYPTVDTRVAQHGGWRLDRDGGAILLYGSMPVAAADRALIAALTAPEPHASATAAKVLAVSLTEPGLAALNAGITARLSTDDRDIVERFTRWKAYTPPAAPSLDRAAILKTVAAFPGGSRRMVSVAGDKAFESSAGAVLTAADVPALRAARRRAVYGVSDEAMAEYFTLTRVLLDVVNRLDLYKQHRHRP